MKTTVRQQLRKVLVSVLSFALTAQPVLAAGHFQYQVPLDPQVTGAAGGGVLAYSQTSVDFGAVLIGQAPKQLVTVTNTGTAAITVKGISATGTGYSQSNNCGGFIIAGGSCNITAQFAPGVAGNASGDITVLSDDVVPTATIGLSGRGQAGTLSASNYTFPTTTQVGESAPFHDIIVTNLSTAPVTVSGVSVTSGGADFAQSNGCSGLIGPSGQCTVRVAFSPSAPGARTGVVSIVSDSDESPFNITVQGTAAAASGTLTLGGFGTVQVGDTATQTATLANTGVGALSVSGISVSGADYGIASTAPDNCTNAGSLAAGATCTFGVSFKPTTGGQRPGQAAATTGAGTLVATLSGQGQAPGASLSAPVFTPTEVGSPVDADATLTNTGAGVITVGTPVVTGSGFTFGSTTCAATLAVGAHCGITVHFQPTTAGAASGQLSVPTQAGTQTAVLADSGTQAVLSFSNPSLAFGSVQVGQGADSAVVTLKNTGTAAASNVAVSVPTDFTVVGSNCTSALAPAATCSFQVHFAPTQVKSYTGSLLATATSPTIGGTTSLTGSGQAQSASLTDVDFGSAAAGTSKAGTATLTNTGVGPVSVTAPTAASVTGSSFSFVSTNCGGSLAAGATCTVSLSYAPSNNSGSGGNLAIVTSAGTQTSTLSGQGLQGVGSVNPGSLSFSPVQVGQASSAQSVVFTNTGNTNLNITGVSIAVGASNFSQSNGCGATLAPNASCTVSVQFNPTTASSLTGTLAMTNDGPGGLTTVSLSGTGRAASATLTPVSFGSATVGSAQTLTSSLSNTGLGPITVTAPSASSVTGTDFSFVSTTCGPSLAASASCLVTVKFAPSAAASRTGTLSFATEAGNQSAALTGTGTQGFATLAPTSLTFAAQQISTTSAAQPVTITNTGTDTLVISGVSVTSGATDFAQSNNCGNTLVVNGTCVINVAFTPSVSGTRNGTVSFTNSGGGVSSFGVTGVGQAPSGTLSNVNFGNRVVGSNNTLTSTVTNTGLGSITITAPDASSVTGTDFSYLSTTCGPTLAASATCTVTVKMSPTSTGAHSGTLSLSTSAGVLSASVIGTGVQGNASLSAATLTYATTQVGTAAATQTVTVTNNGTYLLTLSGITVSAGAADYSQTNTCSSALAVNGTCTITVTFTPSATGSRPGTVSWTNSGAGTTSFALVGSGQAQSATLSAVSFGNVAVGSPSTLASTLTNTGIGSMTFTVPTAASVSGTDFGFVSTDCTGVLAASATCAVSLKFTPTAGVARTGSLSFATSAGTMTAALSGTGLVPNVTQDTVGFGFGNVQVGGTQTSAVRTLTNNGNTTAQGLNIAVPTGFSLLNNTCGTTLSATASCSYQVVFSPTAVQTYSGNVVVSFTNQTATISNGLGSPAGVAQAATLSSPSFPATAVGASSTANATLSNTGIGPLSVTAPTAASVTGAGYSLSSSNCGTTLAVGATCTVTVTFAPTSTTTASGTLTVSTGAGAKSTSLGSTGIQGYASVSPSSLNFGTWQVASTSGLLAVTVTNTGTNTLTFTGVGISTGNTDYTQSNNCGAVPVNGTCTVNVQFTPSTTGTRAGTLSFVHDGGGIANVSLTGVGQAASFTISNVAFGNVSVGGSTTATATLTNTGVGNFVITQPTASSVTGTDFSYSTETCNSWIAAGASCTMTVKFSPTSAVARAGTLTFSTGAGQATSNLTGTGIDGFATLSPTSLTFAAQQVSSASAVKTVTITNTGTDSLTISGVNVSAGATDFTQTNNCGSVMAVNASCTVSVTFTPTTTGTRTGTVSFTNDGGGATSVSLTGTGQGQSATLSAVSFGNVVVGVPATVTSTLTNTGIGTLSITVPTATSVTGTDYSFAGTNCTTTLATAGTCTVSVKFTPTAATARTGNVSVTTGAGAISAALTGTGIQGNASLSASTLTFAAAQMGASATSQTVTVTNNGTSSLTLSGINVSAGSADYSQTNTCSAALAVNGTCTITVSFLPSTTGTRTGTVSWTSNGSGATSLALTGTAQNQSGTLSAVPLGSIAVGTSNTQMSTLTNTGVGPLTVTVPTSSSVTGTDFSFVTTNCPTSLAVGVGCTVSVKFTPTAPTARNGSLTVATGAGSLVAALSGTGLQGTVGLSTPSLGYATTQVGTSAATQAVTVTNTGNSPVTLSGIQVSAGSADYFQTNTCGSALAVNGQCSITVTFTPSAAGARPGTVSWTSSGGGATSFNLAGSGQAQSGTLTNYAAGSVVVGSSAQNTVTLTNTGIGNLSMTAPTSSSVSGTDFSFVNTSCTTVLAPSATCTVMVKFAPTNNVARSGSVSISTGAGAITGTLAGTGIQGTASYSATSLTFSGQTVGTTSAAQSIIVTNTGNSSLTVTGVSVSAGSSDYGISNGCGAAMAVNATCTINVAFTAAAAGTRTGTVTIVTNGSNGTTIVSLTGTGVATASGTMAISPLVATTGSSPTISWTTSNASTVGVSCTAPMTYSYSGTTVNFGGGGVATSGTGISTCTLTPYNSLGVAGTQSTQTVNVIAAPVVTGVSFGAANTTSGAGNTVNWSTTGATSVTVNCTGAGAYSYTGGTVNYSGAGVSTSGTGTATCAVTATNAAGTTASGSNSFQVVAAPTVSGVSFGAANTTSGAANTVNWSTTGATNVAVSCTGAGSYSYSGGTVNYNGAGVSTSGTGTATCSVTAYNAAGASASGSSSFQVVSAPSTPGISFGVANITSGGTNTVNWSTSGATSVSVSCTGAGAYSYSGGVVNYNGAGVTTSGTGTATCSVTAYNAAGSTASASASFQVVAPASVQGAGYTFFNPSSVNAGNSSTFAWQTSGASSASVVCSGAGATATGSGTTGSISVGTTSVGTATCTVTAYNAANDSTTGSATLTVNSATLNLVISANTQNYNVATAAGISSARPVVLTINSGVVVGSTSTGTYALTTGVLPSGSTLTIINNGIITGAGGAAAATSSSSSYVNATAGGPAFQASMAVTVQNNGTIQGGGGGGGGVLLTGAAAYACGGGGGAGWTAGTGGQGWHTGTAQQPVSGSAGSTSAGGTACVYGGSVTHTNPGGGPGAAGGTITTGTSTAAFKLGGAGGAATSGNGNISWAATGNRYGALN